MKLPWLLRRLFTGERRWIPDRTERERHTALVLDRILEVRRAGVERVLGKGGR